MRNRPQSLTSGPISLPSGDSSPRRYDYSYGYDYGAINLMDADGSNIRRITEGGYNPEWSPDGTQIIYDNYVEGASDDIFKVNADGSGVTRLTHGRTSDSRPAFSPRGEEIVFASTNYFDSHLYVMDADGSDIRRLTNTRSYDEFPDWQPIAPLAPPK